MNVPRRIAGTVLAAVFSVTLAGSVRAETHGGIEIGAKGVKATVVDVVNDAGGGYEMAVKFAETKNTTLVAGLAKAGRFDAKALADTVAAVKALHTTLTGQFHVPPERLYVVGSSGLLSPVASKPELVKANQEALASAIKEATGIGMTFIDTAEEARLSIRGIVPAAHRAEATLVDIGSGNTKGGYAADGKYVTFGVPFGTVSFADQVKQFGGAIPQRAAELRESALRPALHKEFAGKPGMTARDRVYLSGGLVWAVATVTHPGESGAFTALTPKDFDAFESRLLASPDAMPKLDLAAVPASARKFATDEYEKVKKVYDKPEQLVAAVQILKALSAEQQLETKRVYFVRYGYLGWLLAYITEKGTAPK